MSTPKLSIAEISGSLDGQRILILAGDYAGEEGSALAGLPAQIVGRSHLIPRPPFLNSTSKVSSRCCWICLRPVRKIDLKVAKEIRSILCASA